MHRRAITAAALAALSLTAAACDQIIRYDFVAVAEDGRRLRGSFTLGLRAVTDDDPTRTSFTARSAAVEGEPAQAFVTVLDDLRPNGDPARNPLDGLSVILAVDALEQPSEVVIALVDSTAQAFASDGVPFPFPSLEAFDAVPAPGSPQAQVEQVSIVADKTTLFSGRLERIEARSIRPAIPFPFE